MTVKDNKRLKELQVWYICAETLGLLDGNRVRKKKLLDLYSKSRGCTLQTAINHFNKKGMRKYFSQAKDRSAKGQLIKALKTKNGYTIEIDSRVSKDIKGVMKNTIVPTVKASMETEGRQDYWKQIKNMSVKTNRKHYKKIYKKVDKYMDTIKDNNNESQSKIAKKCAEITDFLLSKNDQYGDSALTPIRIFSKSDTKEQLRVRIDDKLNRLLQGNENIEKDEDVIKDLIGYLILLLVSMD